jgi:tetratricopeptide (TPR) repeat protein
VALRSDSPGAYLNLGLALARANDPVGAIREYQAALRLDPNYAEAHVCLAAALYETKDVAGAIREYQAAVQRDPTQARVYHNLGVALYDTKDLAGAIRAYQAALQLDPNQAQTHFSLGLTLFATKDLAGAIRAYRAALRIDPKFAQAHCNLGCVLGATKDLAGAIRELQAALQIDPNLAEAHYNLGLALHEKQDLEGAIRAFRHAVRIEPNRAQAYYDLANTLRDNKDLTRAIGEYQAALRVAPNFAEAHCNLGHVLADQGRFPEALAALKTGHQLGSQRADWPYHSADWVRRIEQLLQLDAELAKVLNGDSQPVAAAERLRLAWLCQQPYKQLTVTAARFYAESFAAEAKLADDLSAGYRYNAACAATLAGCGQGKDAGQLDEQERARLRRQARDWLQADLTAWRQQWEKEPSKMRPTVLQQLEHWQRDADLASVRDAEALVRLPQAERAEWQKLWEAVAALRQRAAGMD